MKAGRAVVFPAIFGNSYDRLSDEFPSEYPDPKDLDAYRRSVIKRSMDFSRTLDFVQAYEQLFNIELLDDTKIAFCGFSEFDSICWLVVDDQFVEKNRIKAAILPNTGIANFYQPPEVDQLTYLPRITVPCLMLANEKKINRPYEQAVKRMFSLLPLSDNRKELFRLPNTAWHFPVEQFDRVTNGWLDDFMGMATVAESGRDFQASDGF